MNKISMACIFLLFMPFMVMAELPLGKVPPLVTLQGDDGGRVDGSSWSSTELKGVVSYVFYVDPDEKDMNKKATDSLETLKIPEGSTKSYVIINMDATWAPNIMIERAIADSQAENPDATYVYDKEKTLVKKWNLKSDSFDVLVFAKDGTVVYSNDEKMSDDDIIQMHNIIKENVNK